MITIEKTYTTNVVVDAAEFNKCAGQTVPVNGWNGYAIPVTTTSGNPGSLIYVPNVKPEDVHKRF